MIIALFFSALAVPPGFKEIKSANDCKIYKGPAGSDGIVPVFAECHWSDVPAEKLHALIPNWENHAKVHDTVLSSKIIKTEGGRALVHQVHQLSGISNREVEVWMEKKPIPGGFSYSWKSPGPIKPADGNVATLKHEGFWKVTSEGAGSKVEYQLTYDPGGSVPGFLIRWFQASGTVTTTEELRNAGKK